MALPSLVGANLLNSQTPLSFLLAAFPTLFVCSDLTRWRPETGQGREGFGICTAHCPPPPPKALSSSSVSGAFGSDCLLPGARETLFCLLSYPDCPQFVFPPGGDGKWQGLFWKESFFFLLSLSSSYPLKLQEHIGFFPSLGACVGDLSLLFSPVDSPEVKVGVQSLEVKCFLEDKQECSELITLVMVTHFWPQPMKSIVLGYVVFQWLIFYYPQA